MATTTSPRYSVLVDGTVVAQYARKDAAIKSAIQAIGGGQTGLIEVTTPAGKTVWNEWVEAKTASPSHGVCGRCGKELVNEESAAAGIGPVCAAGGRGGASKARALKGVRKALGADVTFDAIKKVGTQDFILIVRQPGQEAWGVTGISARDCYLTALQQARGIAAAGAPVAA